MIVRAGILYDGTLEPPKRNVDLVVNDGRIEELRVASGQCDLVSQGRLQEVSGRAGDPS